MITVYVIVSIISGFLFGIMDGLINANPLATKLYAFYKPIARTSVNVPAGIIIDLIYGFVMTGIFLILFNCLPGEAGIVKGISYALVVWFFRGVMYVASQWMMFNIPVRVLLYTAVAGLGEMLIIGIFYGIALRPST